jgi:Uma2 family endonuclease
VDGNTLLDLTGAFIVSNKVSVLGNKEVHLSGNGGDKAAREPDLMIVLNAHRERIKPTYLDGIADIVVEIVSPERGERDHGTKYIEYETIGVPEYWLIDPIRREADVYVLGEDQHYHRSVPDNQSSIVSSVLSGFALKPSILWQETLLDSQAAVALVEQME